MEKFELFCFSFGSKNNSNIVYFLVFLLVIFLFSFKWFIELFKFFMIGEGDCISWVFDILLKIVLLVFCFVKMDDISWLFIMFIFFELYIRNSYNRFIFDGFWFDINF